MQQRYRYLIVMEIALRYARAPPAGRGYFPPICGRESMARNILILGASYGSLLATKLLMAGHNVTLVCRKNTAELINREGPEVRIKRRDEPTHRAIFSRNLPGKLDATSPDKVD